MSKIATLMQQAAAGAVSEALAIEDVFSTYLYTGNGSTQTITNGIDLAGEGGMLWAKRRSTTGTHQLVDTSRGVSSYLSSESTAAAVSGTRVSSFNSNGFSLTSNPTLNASGSTYASWTFRKAPRFFDVVTYTNAGSGNTKTVSHNLGVVPGTIIIKDINTSGQEWVVYHRSLGTSKFLMLNDTSAQVPVSIVQSVSDTEFVLQSDRSSSNSSDTAGSDTYVAYLFAHDPLGPSGDGSDGLIACGSYTGGGAGVNVNINLGWEPQWILVKNASATNDWYIVDTMRGLTISSDEKTLSPNLSTAEDNKGCYVPTATGFYTDSNLPVNVSGNTYIYIAIRRGPMREPTSGTEVFALDTLGGTSPNPPDFYSGWPVDMSMFRRRSQTANWATTDRLRGPTAELRTNSTEAEQLIADVRYDQNTGYYDDGNVVSDIVSWMFRRAPGFFDVVAYAGTGTERGVPHNLGVTPEMLIIKARDFSGKEWFVHHTGLTSWSKVLQLQSTGTETNGDTGGNLPTETTFPVNASSNVNGSGYNYIAYLFATLPGISKVGSYTGDGTQNNTKIIDCGFTSGARFVLIKRTDSTGNWPVFDTERGIVAGNDPRLNLNDTSAEQTDLDIIDPHPSGFSFGSNAGTNLNINGASYIFLAIA
jgi:hypothetical protein